MASRGAFEGGSECLAPASTRRSPTSTPGAANQGSAPYSQYVRVQGPGNYSGGFPGLMPGETNEAVVELSVYLPAQGGTVPDIYFTVDPDNVTTKTNDANNTLGPLTVVYGGG